MKRFKQSILDIIKSDADLFAEVAKKMNVKPTSLPTILDRNGNNLNQYSIVTLVATHLDKDPDELLENDVPEEAKEMQN